MNLQKLPKALSLENYLDKGITKLLFLDFDGVLNAFYRNGTFSKRFYNASERFRTPNPNYNEEEARRFDDNYGPGWYREPKTYEIAYSPELIKELNKILESPNVQLIWLTTWREYAIGPVSQMGLETHNPQAYLPWGENNYWGQDGKIRALNKFFEIQGSALEGIKAAYVDDQTLGTAEMNDYKQRGMTPLEGINSLLVCPDANYGISRGELTLIKEFFEDF